MHAFDGKRGKSIKFCHFFLGFSPIAWSITILLSVIVPSLLLFFPLCIKYIFYERFFADRRKNPSKTFIAYVDVVKLFIHRPLITWLISLALSTLNIIRHVARRTELSPARYTQKCALKIMMLKYEWKLDWVSRFAIALGVLKHWVFRVPCWWVGGKIM